MWIALTAALAWAVPTPEEATEAMQEVNARTTGVGFVFLLDSSQSVEPLTEALLSDIADLVNVSGGWKTSSALPQNAMAWKKSCCDCRATLWNCAAANWPRLIRATGR